VTALAKALATGKLTISPDTMVTGIEVDPGSGRATGVTYIDSGGNEGSVSASAIVLAASTVDTPRLVLLSIQRGTMPADLVNTDVVGHHLARGVPDTIGGLVNHQIGTMRMGTSADSSALDPTGRFWDIPNLYVADGSVFPTSGGYNPTLTVQAMAWRTADNIISGGQFR
jgi:choline dehydrogenase-like flavoprotein